jgi:hypothetical protein
VQVKGRLGGGACSGGAGPVACGGGDAMVASRRGRARDGRRRRHWDVTVRAGGVMAVCQSEVTSRGRDGVPGR